MPSSLPLPGPDGTPSGLSSLRVAHVGLVIRDIESKVAGWAAALGVAAPAVSQTPPPEVSQLSYRGSASAARCRQAVLRMPGFAVELLEPIGAGNSTWHEFLRERGEGMHHLAFAAQDQASRHARDLTALGCAVFQSGRWPAGPANSSGSYLYFDSAAPLGTVLELLDIHGPAA
jgi:methylmalonyl-CoA/ethylmalonyl-CoA epimerase